MRRYTMDTLKISQILSHRTAIQCRLKPSFQSVGWFSWWFIQKWCNTWCIIDAVMSTQSSDQQDGVPHAHALLVWGKCSRRLSGLHTGFTDFSFFRYFSHGSTWEYTGVLFNSFLIASDGKEKMWASADHCKPSDFCVMSERTRRQYGGLLCVRVQI